MPTDANALDSDSVGGPGLAGEVWGESSPYVGECLHYQGGGRMHCVNLASLVYDTSGLLGTLDSKELSVFW